jgi:hypothetical protein
VLLGYVFVAVCLGLYPQRYAHNNFCHEVRIQTIETISYHSIIYTQLHLKAKMSYYPVQLYHSSTDVESQDEKEQPLPTESGENAPRRLIFELVWGLVGGFIGFIVRIVSLKASTLVSSSGDAASYLILSEADLGLHALIWISFFAMILTCKSSHRRQVLTSSVVSLMIGVLVGSFFAWNFIDVTLGFPLSWTSKLLSFNLMLIQCWLLYRCHEIVVHQEEETGPENEEEKSGPSILVIV